MIGRGAIRTFAFALFLALIHQGVTAQTVEPPALHCVNIGNNGYVDLTWSLPNNGCGAFISYSIFRADNVNGPYTEIATVTNQSETVYTDNTINGNNQTYYYYMVSNYDCPGATQLSSDTLDNLDPEAPDITYVTVNGGQSELHWNPSPSPEAYGYIVYKAVSTGGGVTYNPIDTVIGANATVYTDPTNSPDNAPQAYTLATIDSCGHAGIINTLPHTTMFTVASPENCAHRGSLSWSAYNNWTDGVAYYKVFASYDGASFVQTDSTTALTGSFDYPAQAVCAYVVAYQTGTGITSASNVVCLPPNPEHPAADLYLHNVTVAAQGVNRLFYSVDSTSDLLNVFIERSEDNVEFNSIALVDPPASLAGLLTYDDSTALTDIKSYYYRVIVKDHCGASDTSNTAKTILLTGFAFTNLTNSITWDNYANELDTVLQYDVQRKSSGAWSVIAPNALLNAYDEDVSALVGDSGTLCYAVEATAVIVFGSDTDTVVSRSNELCLDQLVKIGMPNAFVPGGANPLFKPMLRFTGNKSYQFEIYDRWGGMIFSTKNFDEGWDGTHDGRPAPMGAYAYYVLVVDKLGQKNERKGTVLLIR